MSAAIINIQKKYTTFIHEKYTTLCDNSSLLLFPIIQTAYNYTSSSSVESQQLKDIKETSDGGYLFVGTASITETNGHQNAGY